VSGPSLGLHAPLMPLLLDFPCAVVSLLLGFSLELKGVPLSLDQELLDADDEARET
jgi:hypothetical protein